MLARLRASPTAMLSEVWQHHQRGWQAVRETYENCDETTPPLRNNGIFTDAAGGYGPKILIRKRQSQTNTYPGKKKMMPPPSPTTSEIMECFSLSKTSAFNSKVTKSARKRGWSKPYARRSPPKKRKKWGVGASRQTGKDSFDGYLLLKETAARTKGWEQSY